MEYDKELEASISQALREVERDLSLPNNLLVDKTLLTKMRERETKHNGGPISPKLHGESAP